MSDRVQVVAEGSVYVLCKKCGKVTSHIKGFFSLDGEFHRGRVCETCKHFTSTPEVVLAN